MRKILFRGKRVDNGEWVISDCFYQCDGEIKLWDNPNRDGWVNVKPETIGQYTGIKDKNGTKIFEGDIVLADFEYKDERMEVIFYQCGFKLKSKNCEYYYDYSIHDESADLEVIGNVFDTPELLEE